MVGNALVFLGQYVCNLPISWTSQTFVKKATNVLSIVGKVAAGTELHGMCNVFGKSTLRTAYIHTDRDTWLVAWRSGGVVRRMNDVLYVECG